MIRPPPRVFLSYTGDDLSGHADVAFGVITGAFQWIAVRDRHWAPTGAPALDASRKAVRECDLVVLLLAHRYGSIPVDGDGRTSFVDYEIQEAVARSIPVRPFLVEPEGAWPVKHMEALKDPAAGERLRVLKETFRHTLTGHFDLDPETLRAPLMEALRAFEKEWQVALPQPPKAPGAAPPDRIRGHCLRLAEDCRSLRLLGFGEQLQVKLPIVDAWVPLRVMIPHGLERIDVGTCDVERLGRAERLDEGSGVEDLFRVAVAADRRGVALLGEPGAGKTTAARLLAWRAADGTQGSGVLGLPADVVPVLLRLRRLDEATSLRTFLEAACPDAGRALWRRGRLLWILDGLDEVANPTLRATVSGWIRDAITERPRDWFVVTCRYAGYRDDVVLGADFVEAHVAPLDAAQRRAFVTKWYRAVELEVGARGTDAVLEAQSRAERLLVVLEGPDFRRRRMAEIAANPLLLSVLCIAHRKDTELPRGRVAVYAKATEVLLQHWPRSRGDTPPDSVAARSVLAPLAWWLHQEEGRAEAGEGELAAVVAPHLRALADTTALGTDPVLFLRRVRDGSGILVSPDPGRFGFLHLSFQEYLAAVHAVATGQIEVLADRLESSWWQEVALLALGLEQADAGMFFTRLIESGALERGGEAVAYAFADTLRLPMAPFVAALREEAARGEPARAAAVLRHLSGRTDPELVAAALPLREHADAALALAAEGFLERAGHPRPARRRSPRIGDTLVHPKTGILLSWIPGGSFRMGSDERPEEQPIHVVEVAPFWMGTFPVTNAEYEAYRAANPDVTKPGRWEDRRFNQPRQPVVGVSWEEARAFCTWGGFALPTEAQWEYACRAGTTGRYSCPDEALDEHAWTNRNSERQLHIVGDRKPNPWGLYDVHGNVFDWCLDAYGRYAPGPVRQVARPDSSADRVIRGGSWNYDPGWARSAYRYCFRPAGRDGVVGFRVLLPLPG